MSDIGLENYDTAQSNAAENSQHVVTATVSYVNVFFDGTDNNFFNTTADEKMPGQQSYFNALTNVARMWFSISDLKDSSNVYVEGIGTTRGQKDSMQGLAFGTRETGITARARAAFPAIVKKVKETMTELPALADINVFGFSRGAAAARHFVHLFNTQPELFGPKWKDVTKRINFVGLFDTVSSYAPGADMSFDNDVEQLHLHFGQGYAKKVFHLVALDEHRLNFSVTTIASALAQTTHNSTESYCTGYELCIPGAHSDVGGSYHDTEEEERSLGPFTRDFVYERGWYTRPPQGSDGVGSVIHKRTVKGDYYKVGLTLMVDKAQQHTATQYPPDLTAPAQDPGVQTLQTQLRAFASDEKNTRWDLNEQLGDEKARVVRRAMLHLSFHEDSVAEPANPPRRKGAQGAARGDIDQRRYIPG